jgi:hypothetical protein
MFMHLHRSLVLQVQGPRKGAEKTDETLEKKNIDTTNMASSVGGRPYAGEAERKSGKRGVRKGN